MSSGVEGDLEESSLACGSAGTVMLSKKFVGIFTEI
jgi:hypothetical protein